MSRALWSIRLTGLMRLLYKRMTGPYSHPTHSHFIRESHMRRWHFAVAALIVALGAGLAAQHKAESRDMALLGHSDLQARSAYMPAIHRQGDRYIAYVGHHGGQMLNPLTGQMEPNGTSIVDVTNPRSPRYLFHIPGGAGQGEARRGTDGGIVQRQHPSSRRPHEGLSAALHSAAPDTRSGTSQCPKSQPASPLS